MLRGFRPIEITVDGVRIAGDQGGAGPPVLLLHGYPQSRRCWDAVASELARDCTVVVADLRGYGQSDAPPGDPTHASYSKRRMSDDMVALMASRGFGRFAVAGHDRGGRVAHRMALDHPEVVERLAVLDIVPTLTLFEGADQDFATAYYHWFFLIQPDGLPERMIGADPEWFVRETIRRWSGSGSGVPESAVRAYVEDFRRPATIHASCEDYRAAASIDLEHDRADRGRRVGVPTLVLWGEMGAMHRLYDVLDTWRSRAEYVRGHTLPCGHFLPEECPALTAAALGGFLAEGRIGV